MHHPNSVLIPSSSLPSSLEPLRKTRESHEMTLAVAQESDIAVAVDMKTAVLTDLASSLAETAPRLRSLPPSFAATFTSSASFDAVFHTRPGKSSACRSQMWPKRCGHDGAGRPTG